MLDAYLLLSIEETRKTLGYSRVHIWRLTKQKKLTAIYLGNHPFFRRSEVEKLNEKATTT